MKNHDWPEPPGQLAFPIAKAGHPLIGAAAFTTAVLALLGWAVPTVICLTATFFICWFFRDPDRLTPEETGAVVSPADGKVVFAEKVDDCPFLEGPHFKVSIFMSVFNVHVNRSPFDGTVTEVRYHPGKFFSANLDKSSRENEHNAITLVTSDQRKICFVQIAGLIARRIICNVKAGDAVNRGQRIGLICFGSRLDVYLPPDSRLNVNRGDTVLAGMSVLGHLTD